MTFNSQQLYTGNNQNTSSINNNGDIHHNTAESQEIVLRDDYTDFETAQRYITALTSSLDTKVTFACLDDKDKGQKPEVLYGTLTEHWVKLCELNEDGYGIFVTIQETSSIKRKTPDIGRTRSLYVDIDKVAALPEFHVQPSMIVETSPGKFHPYWILKEPVKQSSDEFKQLIVPLIKHYGSDETCKDLPRVLRVPGFYHQKGESVKVKLLELSDRRYSVDEVKIFDTKKIKSDKAGDNTDTPSNDREYTKALKKACSQKIEEIKSLKRGKRHTTLNKKCYCLGGLLALVPGLFEQYKSDVHDLVSALEESGEWDIRAETHSTIDSAFEDGRKTPIRLDLNIPVDELKIAVLEWMEDYADLRWNSMKLRVEFNGKEADTNYLHRKFMDLMNFPCGKEVFRDLIIFLAKENSYHPVEEYLNSLETEDVNDAFVEDILENVLYYAMHINDNSPIQKEMVKKWLIGCVARIYDPGCKLDNVLITKSPQQGINKTTFFETLFGDFFQTASTSKSEADELLNLQQAWVSEWGEIESTFDKKGISALKSFLTKREDIFRAPYAPAPMTIKRQFAFCGTTNEEEFLSDVTGNRRYWIVDISEKINLEIIENYRDDIFRAIKYLYQKGVQGMKQNGKIKYAEHLWWMNDEDEKAVTENVKSSEQIDSLDNEIMIIMKRQENVTSLDIQRMLAAIDIELPHTRATDMRIANILKRNGIGKAKIIMVNGIRNRYYRWDAHWDLPENRPEKVRNVSPEESDKNPTDEDEAVKQNIAVDENEKLKAVTLEKYSVNNCGQKYKFKNKTEWVNAIVEDLNCMPHQANSMVEALIKNYSDEVDFKDVEVDTWLQSVTS